MNFYAAMGNERMGRERVSLWGVYLSTFQGGLENCDLRLDDCSFILKRLGFDFYLFECGAIDMCALVD